MALPKTFKTMSLGVVSRGWSQITGMLLALLAARILGKHDYGIYAVASLFVIMLQVLMYCGIYDYIIRSRDEEIDADSCFWMNLGFSIFGACLIAVLAPVMGAAMHSFVMMKIMLLLAPSQLLAASASWQEALLLRQGRLTTYYRLALGTETLACSAGVASLLLGGGIWSFVVYRYAQLAFSTSAYFAAMRLLPRLRWHRATAKNAMSFAGNLYLGTIVGMISAYSADLLIGLMVSPAAAGSFRLATRLALGVSEVAYQPVGTIAWVHFSQASGDEGRLRKEWRSLTVALSVVVWPALAGLALLSKSVIDLLVGRQWDSAAPVLTIIAIGRMAYLIQVLLLPLLGSQGRTGVILKLNLASAVMTLSLLAVFAHYGALGASSVQLGVTVVLAFAGMVVAIKAGKFRLREFLGSLTPGLLATLATLVCASAVAFDPEFSGTPAIHIAVTAAAGVAGWAATLALVFGSKMLRGRLACQAG